jgi:Na+-driven multidrug efflux pump
VLFVLFAPQLLAIFTSDATVADYGIRSLRIVSAGFLFYGFGTALTAAFNGAGDTRTPTLIHFFCLWLWEIPLPGRWPPVRVRADGVFIAVSVAFSTLALVSAVLFREARGKRTRVSARRPRSRVAHVREQRRDR